MHAFPWWAILLALAVAGILVLLFDKMDIKKNSNHRHIIKLKGFHIGLKEGFTTILLLKKRRLFLFHTVFIWTMYLLEIYIGFYALSATSGLGRWSSLKCTYLLQHLAMIVAPGGIGAFPVAIQQVLLIYSIDNISFGWLMWGVAQV